jgi:hypothetical protein
MKILLSVISVYLLSFSYLYSQSEYESEPNIENCSRGVLKSEIIQDVVDRVNFIRSLHKLSPVVFNHNGSQMSAEGCLNIVASGQGGHIDDPSSECYTTGGGEARMKSNLFQAWGPNPINYSSVSSIDGWMIDNNTSNPEKVGHRRAIINPFLKQFSFGKADGYTKDGSMYMVAMNFLYQDYVTGGITDDIDFIAYPFENYPPELVDKNFYLSFSAIYNKSGAFANGDVNYSNAKVSVSDENGNIMQVSSIQSDLEGWGSLPNNLVFKVNGLKEEVKYDVEITDVVINGQSMEYDYWFRLTDISSSEPPSVPVLLTPENNKKDASITQSFFWEKSQFASSYHIQIATDSEFNNIVDEEENFASVSFAAANNFDYKTQYFWRVRAKNQNGESDWSEIRTFTTGSPVPGEITIIHPVNSAKNISPTPTLIWRKDSEAIGYDMEIWDNIDMMGWSEISANDIADTSYTVENDDALDTETEYFWRVRAVNNSGNGQWTALSSFTTDDGTSVISDKNVPHLKVSPNPFSDECFITFYTQNSENVKLEIFDINGNRVYLRNIGITGIGENTILYDAGNQSGVYLIKLSIGRKVYQKKMIILK